jgi:hypothetical protein
LEATANTNLWDPAYLYNGYDALNANDSTVRINGVSYNDSTLDWYVIGYDGNGKTVTLLSKQTMGATTYPDTNRSIRARGSCR